MASPLGHALAGLAIGRIPDSEHAGSAHWLVPACALLAIAPDLDFVPGWIAGQPALYHQGVSHSFFVGALTAAAAALLIARGSGVWRCFAWLFAAYVSHLAIDWLAGDTRPPIGMPLFWPFSDATFISPVPILPGISHSPHGVEGRAAWLASLLDGYNLRALGVELLVCAPLLAVVEWRRRRAR